MNADLLKCLSLLLGLLLINTGCVEQPENAVIVYSAADREYAHPVLTAFERKSEGIEVVAQYDVESTKTVGLANRIVAESKAPKCDLFWNNEIMHTLNLEKEGLLQSISWDIPSDWPADMHSQSGNWVGFGARARVILVNTNLIPDANDDPKSVDELADPKWLKKCGLARPLFGTTATHFTVLFDQLGTDRALDFFKQVQDNAIVLSGNKQVALQVSAGQLAWGLTDTDDALIELDAGMPVRIVFPDQQPGQLGTLRIPNTVAVLANCQHPVAAEKLANYLVSENTEGRLAMGSSGQIPIRPEHPQQSRAQVDANGLKLMVRWMDVDFNSAADRWSDAAKSLEQLFP